MYVPGVILALLMINPCLTLDNSKLAPVGIISAAEHELAIYTNTLSGSIAVRFLPNLPANLTHCQKTILDNYNVTVTRILKPIADNLNILKHGLEVPKERLVGAIIGTVALGVATSAQITAAVAVAQAQQNAKDIWKLKNAILSTNEAVLELKTGLQQTAIALDKIQDYINNEIIPTVNNLTCEVMANRLGVYLSLYLTELTTVFGNQITNPALSTISYQGLTNLCGNNIGALTKLIGLKDDNVESIYEAGLITGQVVDYDPASQILIIQVSYPSISRLSDIRATELITVGVTTPFGEGRAIVPKYVAQSTVLIEELDISSCKFSSTTLYCTQINTRPLPPRVSSCLKGDYENCQFTTEVGVLASRYASIGKGVVVNCRSIICKCLEPPRIIPQNSLASITVIDSKICKKLQLPDVILRLDGNLESQYFTNISINGGQVTPSGPLDISSEIGNINQTVNRVEDLIHESESWLSRVNPKLISNTAIIVLCVLSSLCVLWLILITAFMAKLLSNVKKIERKVAVSSLIGNPYVYTNPGYSGSKSA
ncbi:fusion protein [avian paramyxovirus 15]|uniref:Fusion glycoprotein F0 n=1 Tax=avian paramyxovirus 15 TaxID=1983777 RepID=A0A1W6R4T0_9MONO|nr:fusion protein [Avian paramyxovirus 15]ARO49356.1 fusion protein [Avian paramyxovirus 15]